ncbi:MAG: STAS domain-containing protein [Desulfovibrio sp.]|nr:MAG: STAS domain-containing protein [Desulfovibrio sp.]
MDDEILLMFQEDTRESLAGVEARLLDIEEAGEDHDPELVHEVFRSAHSIKGSAGFLALDTIRDLSHKIETVLDMMRTQELQPTKGVINVVLGAFDRLGELVEDLAHSNLMDVSDHVQALMALASGSLPPERQQSVTTMRRVAFPDGRTGFEVSEHDLARARVGGNYLYLVEYDLIHDLQRKEQTPFDLLAVLGKSGMVLDCRVDLGAVGDLGQAPANYVPMYLLFACILEPDMVKAVLQVDQERIHTVPVEGEGSTQADPTLTQGSLLSPAAPVLDMEAPLPQEDNSLDPDELAAMEREFDLAMAKQTGGASGDVALGPESEPQAGETVSGEESAPLETIADSPEQEATGFEHQGNGDKGSLLLRGALTIDRAQELKQALLAALDTSKQVDLEFRDVVSVDLAALQLLIAAFQSGKARGIGVSCVGDLGPLLDFARSTGFTSDTVKLYGMESFLPSEA